MICISRLAVSYAFIASTMEEPSTRRIWSGPVQTYGASRMEKAGLNWPNCAAPSSTIWMAPEDVASIESREEPSWPLGNVSIETAPEVASFTFWATLSIIAADGWLTGSTLPHRRMVGAARAVLPSAAARPAPRALCGVGWSWSCPPVCSWLELFRHQGAIGQLVGVHTLEHGIFRVVVSLGGG
jgi:hypothetical protein